jgi:hypothetical protein
MVAANVVLAYDRDHAAERQYRSADRDGMRTAFQLGSGALLVVGGGIVAIAAYMIGFALFAPTRPPPSLNEGHGLAFFFGVAAAFVGLVLVSVGVAIRVGLRRADSALTAAESAVAADDRRRGPLGG